MSKNVSASQQADGCRHVIVVGAGLAGVVAALEARAKGAEVTLVDERSSDRFGGNTRVSGGAFLAPVDDTTEAQQDFVNSLMAATAGEGNSELFGVLASNVLKDLAWLREMGAAFLPTYASPPPHRSEVHLLSPGQFLGMPDFMKCLRSALDDARINLRWGTTATEIARDANGAVTFVQLSIGEEREWLSADAVVLAGGGYSSNRELLSACIGLEMEQVAQRGVDGLRGACIELAKAVGGEVRNMGGLGAVHIAAVSPDCPGSGNPSRALPHAIAINAMGRRYVDESRGYVANGKASLEQPGQTIAIVFDEALKEALGVRVALQTYANNGLPVVAAPTLSALAEAINVPPASLIQTVEAFNAAVDKGAALTADVPKVALASKIDTPPYYAFYPCRPAVTLTFGGVTINRRANVMTNGGALIPGLYSCGEMAGALFRHDYLGGGSFSNCLVMGRIAGREAAKGDDH